jgi:hypothetical protein
MLFDQGGFYLDINKLVIAPLRSFIRADSRGLISFERTWCQLPATPEAAARLQHPSRYLLQWCLGFAPGHPLLAAVIANICRYAPAYEGQSFEDPSEAVRSLTGPGLFSLTVLTHVCQSDSGGNSSSTREGDKEGTHDGYFEGRCEPVFRSCMSPHTFRRVVQHWLLTS